MKDLMLRIAKENEATQIWGILQQAIEKRKNEGSRQWQDGYPNLNVVKDDIEKNIGYVVENLEKEIIAYVVLMDFEESAYNDLDGKWLSDLDYIAIHRLAVDQNKKIKGLAVWIMEEAEKIAVEKNIFSIKVDTNFDNDAMLHILKKLGYQYCGEVHFRGASRKAFEKLLR